VQRFHVLVAVMLSSQTKDAVTAASLMRLRAWGLTAERVAAADEAELAGLVYPVGFYRNKARFLRSAAAACLARHGGDIPDTIEGLTALDGVGPKMAFLAMNVAWGRALGIAVDVHVHRIAQRLRWVPAKVRGPEDSRVALQEWLPPALWPDVNLLLVGFGQTVCLPLQPRCHECPVAALCPEGRKHVRKGARAAEGGAEGAGAEAEAGEGEEAGAGAGAEADHDVVEVHASPASSRAQRPRSSAASPSPGQAGARKRARGGAPPVSD
jgi:endonuclease-3